MANDAERKFHVHMELYMYMHTATKLSVLSWGGLSNNKDCLPVRESFCLRKQVTPSDLHKTWFAAVPHDLLAQTNFGLRDCMASTL